jgi:hypothetical protein
MTSSTVGPPIAFRAFSVRATRAAWTLTFLNSLDAVAARTLADQIRHRRQL